MRFLITLLFASFVGCGVEPQEGTEDQQTVLVPPGPDEYLLGVEVPLQGMTGSGTPRPELTSFWGTPMWAFAGETPAYVTASIPQHATCDTYKVDFTTYRYSTPKAITGTLQSADGLDIYATGQTSTDLYGPAETVTLFLPERLHTFFQLEMEGSSINHGIYRVRVWYVCQLD